MDAVFETLNTHGMIALQNAGYTMSDGRTEVAEALHRRGRENVQGDCFYHGQDLERAVAGEALMRAFGSLDDDRIHKLAVGQRVREILEGGGFNVQWNGDSEQRLNLPGLDWKRRGPTA